MKNTRISQVKGDADVRWGIIFLENKDKPIISFFLDKSGHGYIDDIPVTFTEIEPGAGIYGWLKQKFQPIFK